MTDIKLDETFTVAELAGALLGTGNGSVSAIDLVRHIKDHRKPEKPPFPGDETFTKYEIEAALNRLGYIHLPAEIFENVRSHREPVWKHGDVVMAADGTVFRRRMNGGWSSVGTGTVYKHEYPVRPLKRLVPES